MMPYTSCRTILLHLLLTTLTFQCYFTINNNNNNRRQQQQQANTFNWAVDALDNGLALTPPMGWLAWERYVCELNCDLYPNECIDQNLFLQMATRLVEDGYKQLGYEYVNIDDCWSERERDQKSGKLRPDLRRFPSLEDLSKRIHSLGLKLGIYGDCGTATCQNFPGQLKYQGNLSENYFNIDAQSFADWGIDSFKFDGCNLAIKQAAQICPQMERALNETKRPMLFSCSWPAYENEINFPTNWELVVQKCNLWRAFGDIEDSWKSVLDTIDWFVRKQDIIVKYHGPGHWFDADQLVIGNFGLSAEQERAQMAIWCIWASPLYMSNDLRSISKESSKILKNKYAIEVNQDRMGIFGLMVEQTNNKQVQVFVKPVEPIIDNCPSYAIVYLDRRTLGNGRLAGFRLFKLIDKLHEQLVLTNERSWSKWSQCSTRTSVHYNAYDLFNDFAQINNKPLNLTVDNLELRVDPSGARMIKLIQQTSKVPDEPVNIVY